MQSRNHPEPPAEFFARHPYFFAREFIQGRDRRAAERALYYHCRTKHLLNVRKGTYLWYSLRKKPDPFLLGSRLVEGVVGYSSALWYHGAIQPRKLVTVISRTRLPELEFAGITYRSVKPSRHFPGADQVADPSVDFVFRGGLPLAVTNISRSIVDCLDRLDLAPALETLWAITLDHPDIDLKLMVEHALRLGSAVTAARVGLFLECHPKLIRQRPDLGRLSAVKPPRSVPMDSHHPPERCERWPGWNLLVPTNLCRRLEERR